MSNLPDKIWCWLDMSDQDGEIEGEWSEVRAAGSHLYVKVQVCADCKEPIVDNDYTHHDGFPYHVGCRVGVAS